MRRLFLVFSWFRISQFNSIGWRSKLFKIQIIRQLIFSECGFILEFLHGSNQNLTKNSTVCSKINLNLSITCIYLALYSIYFSNFIKSLMNQKIVNVIYFCCARLSFIIFRSIFVVWFFWVWGFKIFWIFFYSGFWIKALRWVKIFV